MAAKGGAAGQVLQDSTGARMQSAADAAVIGPHRLCTLAHTIWVEHGHHFEHEMLAQRLCLGGGPCEAQAGGDGNPVRVRRRPWGALW